MKTNLDAFFKTNKEEELEGIWFTISETTRFRVRRMGGANTERAKKAWAKYYKPYSRQVQTGSLSEEKSKELAIRVFFDVCLVTWEGVEIDGKTVDCTIENAIKLFTQLPELLQALEAHASDMETFKEDLGND